MSYLLIFALLVSLSLMAQELPVEVTPDNTETQTERRRSRRENRNWRQRGQDLLASPGNMVRRQGERNRENRQSRRENRYERMRSRMNEQHRLSLDLTTAATSTPSSHAQNIILEPSLNSEVVKTYNDPYSGFQAYKIKTTNKKGKVSYTYAFAATQVSARDQNDPTKMVPAQDRRDLATNASFGLHQMESLQASALLDDVMTDMRAGNRITMTGQSLGGMLSHSLGYIALRRLRESNELKLRNKLKITSWGSPGVTDLIRDYMKKRLGVDEQLDPKLTSENFESIYYDIDLLPKVGQHFGKVVVISDEVLTPEDDSEYAMNVPGIRRNFEAHVNPGFLRAVERDGINYQEGEILCPPERGFRLTEPLQKLSRYFSRLYLDSQYKKYLEENGTEEDWNQCYESPTWSTNLNRRCTEKSQRGCLVHARDASREEKRGKAKWCLPEVNPLSNARYRAPRSE